MNIFTRIFIVAIVSLVLFSLFDVSGLQKILYILLCILFILFGDFRNRSINNVVVMNYDKEKKDSKEKEEDNKKSVVCGTPSIQWEDYKRYLKRWH